MPVDLSKDEFAQRRAEVVKNLGDNVLVVFSAEAHLRNNDVDYDYRQDSDFFYLTGFEEPESALVLRRGEPSYSLFVRPRNRERETWEGRRVGVEGATTRLGADAAFAIQDLTQNLADLIEDRGRVQVFFGDEVLVDPRVARAVQTVRGRRRKRVEAPREIVDARGLLHELRRKKRPAEIAAMRRAADATVDGHTRAMELCRPGMNEFELQTIVETAFRQKGARRLAYSSIVGAGENGTILHYRENESPMRDGDLVLIDAGAEFDYYAADVTRTFPVNGKFTPIQKRAYEIVLAAQEASIALCVAGKTIEEVHEASFEVLQAGFVELGLISADAEDPKKDAQRYYMHRTSHYLGMDVHDVGSYFEKGEPRLLEPGVVITVEPGLYVAPDDEFAPRELLGIGIRIEDDVLVTEGAPEVMTRAAPKTVSEIEAACARGRAAK